MHHYRRLLMSTFINGQFLLSFVQDRDLNRQKTTATMENNIRRLMCCDIYSSQQSLVMNGNDPFVHVQRRDVGRFYRQYIPIESFQTSQRFMCSCDATGSDVILFSRLMYPNLWILFSLGLSTILQGPHTHTHSSKVF